MMNTNLTTSQETELNKVIERIRSYANPPLAPSEPLRLEADGLSENPGVDAKVYICSANPPAKTRIMTIAKTHNCQLRRSRSWRRI